MASDKLGSEPIRLFATALIALAALNLGMAEFADFDLIHDGLSFAADSTEYTATIGVVAAAGAVQGYNTVVDFMD